MRKPIKALYKTKRPYDDSRNTPLFVQAIKHTIEELQQENPYYDAICQKSLFQSDELNSEANLGSIPVIPTLFFKRNDIGTKRSSLIEVTSSGTSGKVSRVNVTLKELRLLASMSIRMGKIHRLISFRPTRYMILGYQPNRKNKMVISKTAYLSSYYTPVISRTYALCYHKGTYELKLEALMQKLVRFSKKRSPVRLVGFPAYTYFLLQQMQTMNITCCLPEGSKLMLGGGWKQFSEQEVTKETLYQLVFEILGIAEENIHEFFGAAEHPVIYCTCKNHHFHVPAYGKVLVRDTSTLKVLPKGEVGLLNLLTPMKTNLPLVSVMTDDLAVLHDGRTCGCGIQSDYFDILGRVGVEGVKTCSAGAKEYLRGMSNVIN